MFYPIWQDLKNHVPDAYARLVAAPDHIREAVLLARVEGESKQIPLGNPLSER